MRPEQSSTLQSVSWLNRIRVVSIDPRQETVHYSAMHLISLRVRNARRQTAYPCYHACARTNDVRPGLVVSNHPLFTCLTFAEPVVYSPPRLSGECSFKAVAIHVTTLANRFRTSCQSTEHPALRSDVAAIYRTFTLCRDLSSGVFRGFCRATVTFADRPSVVRV